MMGGPGAMFRRAILVGFVGASLWVLAPLMVASLQVSDYDGDQRGNFALALQRMSGREYTPSDGWRTLFVRTVQGEIVVVTITGIAWILVGLVKPRA